MDMLDGRQDDVNWFVCNVIQFIFKGKLKGEKTLVHCEKGVSRSCSFVIAYHMWAMGTAWKVSFDYVKSKRVVCNPNTAFTCNLIEFGELIVDDNRSSCVIMRCSSHLPHDQNTPVLKICRYNDSRKVVALSNMSFDCDGAYVVRPGDNYKQAKLYIWVGSNSNQHVCDITLTLAKNIFGIFTRLSDTLVVEEGAEPAEWNELFKHYKDAGDGNLTSLKFDDLYKRTNNQPVLIPVSDEDLQKKDSPFTLLSDDKSKFNAPKKVPLSLPVSANISKEETGEININEAEERTGNDDSIIVDQDKNVDMVTEIQHFTTNIEPSVVPDPQTTPEHSTKPVLYRAVPSSNVGTFKWESLGIFDDDDLVENCILLLHCVDNIHYAWIGADIESPPDAVQWLHQHVERGELHDDAFLTSTIMLNFSGKESDDFWNKFNLGM